MIKKIDWPELRETLPLHQKVFLDYISRLRACVESYKNGEINVDTALKTCKIIFDEIDDPDFPFFAIRNFRGLFSIIFYQLPKILALRRVPTLQSEEQKRQLLNSVKEGVYQCEPGVEGVFTWVNQASAEIFGYKSPEEMIGTKVEDIYVDLEDRRKLVEKLEKDGVWMNFVSFCKKKNGERFYTERTSNMIKDARGKPVRIEGIIRDITERKRLEDELKKSEGH